MEFVTIKYDLTLSNALLMRDLLNDQIDHILSQRKARKAERDRKRKGKRG